MSSINKAQQIIKEAVEAIEHLAQHPPCAYEEQCSLRELAAWVRLSVVIFNAGRTTQKEKIIGGGGPFVDPLATAIQEELPDNRRTDITAETG